MKKLMKEKRGQFIIIAAMLISFMIVSLGAVMHRAVTYYKQEPWQEYLTLTDQVSLNSQRLIELSLVNFTNSIAPTANIYNETVIYVSHNTSDVDGQANKGSFSDFSAQQSADSTYDTLVEHHFIGGIFQDVFIDGFENNSFTNWEDNGITNWQIGTVGSGTGGSADPYDGTYDAWADQTHQDDLLSNNFDLSIMDNASLSFWFQKDDTEGSDFQLYYYDGGSYVLIEELDTVGSDDVWTYWSAPIASEYLISDFHVKFDAVLGNNENVWVDELIINGTTAENHQLALEVQWTNLDYAQEEEFLCVHTGSSNWGAEPLRIDVWNATSSTWLSLSEPLSINSWNNISISEYLNASSFTIRFVGGIEVDDLQQDSWDIDCSLIHVWSSETTFEVSETSLHNLDTNLQQFQTDLVLLSPGYELSFDYTLVEGEDLNYTLGYAYDWGVNSSISSAKANFSLSVIAIGLSGYESETVKTMNVTIVNATDTEILLTVKDENNVPIHGLSHINFFIAETNITSVSSQYDPIEAHLYKISCEEAITLPLTLTIWDQKGVKVVTIIN